MYVGKIKRSLPLQNRLIKRPKCGGRPSGQLPHTRKRRQASQRNLYETGIFSGVCYKMRPVLRSCGHLSGSCIHFPAFCLHDGVTRRYVIAKGVTKRDTPERVRVATSRYDWLRFVTVRDRLLPLFAGFFRPASVLLSPERDAYCTEGDDTMANNQKKTAALVALADSKNTIGGGRKSGDLREPYTHTFTTILNFPRLIGTYRNRRR